MYDELERMLIDWVGAWTGCFYGDFAYAIMALRQLITLPSASLNLRSAC